MKKLIILFGILILIGAGCASGDSDNVSLEDITIPGQEKTIKIEKETSMQPIIQTWKFPGVLSEETIANKQIRIQTEKGDIVFELFNETAPMAVSNFVYLASNTYFNGLTFHRRDDSIHIIQGGDPAGNGTGGPGYTFPDELDDDYTYEKGIVAMANRGPNTNGSQFFIMLDDFPFQKNYTIFGRVIEGLDVAEQIQVGDKMILVTVEDKE